MPSRDEIVEWTNDYLRLHEYKDYGPMGLQYTGTFHPAKIATAVSVCQEVIEQAGAWGADILFTHHGLWWNNESRLLDKRTLGRIELAKYYDMSILGYHLCLDAHEEIGNNILLLRAFGVVEESIEPFGGIGWGATRLHAGKSVLIDPTPAHNFLTYYFCDSPHVPYQNATVFEYGPDEIQRIAVIAGGAPSYLTQAHREGYDLFITGEAAEFTMYQAQELGMHFVAAGHHRTEKAGISALGQKLSDEFGLDHRFFDVANPI
jgi:dinuclear metal center YbgI/SA1388 family protein